VFGLYDENVDFGCIYTSSVLYITQGLAYDSIMDCIGLHMYSRTNF
jgi:hypothetical protein